MNDTFRISESETLTPDERLFMETGQVPEGFVPPEADLKFDYEGLGHAFSYFSRLLDGTADDIGIAIAQIRGLDPKTSDLWTKPYDEVWAGVTPDEHLKLAQMGFNRIHALVAGWVSFKKAASTPPKSGGHLTVVK